MRSPFLLLAGLLSLLGFQSCSLFQTDEVAPPAYIYIPSVSMQTDTINKSDKDYEGDNTTRIEDAWIYDNGGTLIGAIGLPALVPVKLNNSDSTQLRIEAGVLKSGQLDLRIPYPIYQPYYETRLLRPGKIDTIRPVFHYFKSRKFAFIEDFDRPGFRFAINPVYRYAGDTVITVNDNRARRPGFNSGMLAFSKSNPQFQIYTEDEFTLPGLNVPTFLELDYNTNLPLDVGYYYDDPITGPSAAISVIQLYPTSGWNKVYIALNDELVGKNAGTLYKFYIGVFNSGTLQPAVYLDNIKLVYLE